MCLYSSHFFQQQHAPVLTVVLGPSNAPLVHNASHCFTAVSSEAGRALGLSSTPELVQVFCMARAAWLAAAAAFSRLLHGTLYSAYMVATLSPGNVRGLVELPPRGSSAAPLGLEDGGVMCTGRQLSPQSSALQLARNQLRSLLP